MIFKKLEIEDTKSFCDLILDMYSHLDNIEWFSPMPYDCQTVQSIIENPRFFVMGVFDNKKLCAVSSFDYKCGKLIGKIDFPKECDTNSLVEIGFTMVHSKYRGQGIMKQLVKRLIMEAKLQGFEWIFAKVHKDNLASSTSLLRNGFYKALKYNKPLKIKDVQFLIANNILNHGAKKQIENKIASADKAEFIEVDYDILLRNCKD